jgi:hypothetical protein
MSKIVADTHVFGRIVEENPDRMTELVVQALSGDLEAARKTATVSAG